MGKAKAKKRGTAAARPRARRGEPDYEYRQLVAAAAANSFRFFNVAETRVLFKIPKAAMEDLRRLAAGDPLTDPWRGTITTPQKFADWFWTVRPRLEHPELFNGKPRQNRSN